MIHASSESFFRQIMNWGQKRSWFVPQISSLDRQRFHVRRRARHRRSGIGKSSQTTVSRRGQKVRWENFSQEPATTQHSPMVAS